MAHLTRFEKRRQRVRTALRQRAAGRPRLSVHRSGRHIYAQLIDDAAGATLASASTLDKDVRGKTGATTAAAADVGKRLAAAAKKAGFQKEDVIVAIDGLTKRTSESELIGYLLLKRQPGERVKATVLRGAERLEFSFPMQ